MSVPIHVHWNLDVEDMGEGSRVTLRGPNVALDEADTEVVEEKLSELVEELGRCRLLLDLANVSYLNSSTLNMLIRLHKRLNSMGGSLILMNLQPHIGEIFAITKLNQLLDIRHRNDSAE